MTLVAVNVNLAPFCATKYIAVVLLGLLLAACSTGVVVHDQDRAAELLVDFLTAIKSDEGIQLSYDWTDDKFKEEITFSEFSRIVASIRMQNRRADIRLRGYEVFGPVELIVVYADSQTADATIYYRFVLVGTKIKDYYLLDLFVDDKEFEKEGVYRDYGQTIVVKGV